MEVYIGIMMKFDVSWVPARTTRTRTNRFKNKMEFEDDANAKKNVGDEKDGSSVFKNNENY